MIIIRGLPIFEYFIDKYNESKKYLSSYKCTNDYDRK